MKYYLCKMVLGQNQPQNSPMYINTNLDVVADLLQYPYSLPWKENAERSVVQGHPQFHGKFEAKDNPPQQQLLNKYCSSC